MVTFFIYLAAFAAVYFIFEKIARRTWGIPKQREPGIHGGNTLHTWGLRIGWAVFFVTAVFSGSGLLPAIILIMIWSFHAFMQWKYHKAQREYMITLLGLGFFIIFIAVGYTFDLLI
ncbi:DUF4181 domain-containing protein [Rossellomorea oryzaecorticis]|uniref:DUF4181 domain-containing protein n=1 Tax=Rossellomorea oryzaecorticis TaxID=1396505 RepID=A0ABU9K6L2_9BACI